MRYPTLSKSQVAELAPARLATGTSDAEIAVTWSGDGDEIQLEPIAELAASLRVALAEFVAGPDRTDRDLFEGLASGRLHSTLYELPLLVLDDPGFWRYLALVYFWDLIVWRESATFETAELARYRQYIDATNPSESVLLRMFLRGQIALEDGGYELASAILRGTDFWRSHILRVRTSSAPVMSRALVREQVADRMGTKELRAFARRLNRIRSNLVFDVYDDAEAATLLAELRNA